MLLDDIFSKQSIYTIVNGQTIETAATAYELPLIEMGKCLGNFVQGECGFDVVLDFGDYKLPDSEGAFVFDLAYARAPEVKVDISSEPTDYARKVKKEQVCQFIDVAAFYGSHYSENGVVVTDNNGEKVNKKKNEIYNDIINSFLSRNKFYLYIQSDRNRSYNFYNNYLIQQNTTASLKIGIDEASLTNISFSEHGWPLLVDELPRIHNESRNSLYMQLVTDNDLNTALYGQLAQIENAEKNNFISANDLKLTTGNSISEAAFSRPIIISVPAVDDNGQKKNVACFNLLLYQGKKYNYVAGQFTDTQNITTDILAEVQFLDDLFGLVNAEPALKSNDANQLSNICSKRLKILNFDDSNGSNKGIAAMQTLIVNDTISTGNSSSVYLDRVTFICEAVNVLNTSVTNLKTISGNTQSSTSSLNNISVTNTYQLSDKDDYDFELFTDSSQTITGIKLKTLDHTLPNKLLLGIAKAEYESLRALISNDKKNPGIIFINAENSNQLTSSENINYEKFKIGIVAEDSTGKLNLSLPNPAIIIYSIDKRYYLSKIYSENMIRYSYIEDLVLDTRL